MPEQETLERAREDAAEGKSPSTQAGEFVRDEIEHVREGKHGARSAKQAIAIGLPRLGELGSSCRLQEVRPLSKLAERPDRTPKPRRSRINLRGSAREQ